MEKVRPWCGQSSDRGRLKNRTARTVTTTTTAAAAAAAATDTYAYGRA